MQQLHGTGRDSERQQATMSDSDRHVAIPWDRRDSERQPATIRDSEILAATPWFLERQ